MAAEAAAAAVAAAVVAAVAAVAAVVVVEVVIAGVTRQALVILALEILPARLKSFNHVLIVEVHIKKKVEQ